MKPFLIITTSSPCVGVAVAQSGETNQTKILANKSQFAERNAEEATFLLLHETLTQADLQLEDIAGIVVDVGPGSFTGVRVGVTIAKTLAWAKAIPVAGIRSFELIGPPPVALPSRRGRYLVLRESGEVEELDEERASAEAQRGYGAAFEDQRYPEPAMALKQWASLRWIKPEELVPEYVLEPGISVPKVPYPNRSQE